MGTLERQIEELQKGQQRVSRTLDSWQQTCQWVVEGSEALESLYKEEVEDKELGGGWWSLKAKLPEKVLEEVARHVGFTWPLPAHSSETWTQTKRECWAGIGQALVALKADPPPLEQVYEQYAKPEPGQEKTRIEKLFHIKLRPGHSAWQFERGMLGAVDGSMRWASGLWAWGEPPPGMEPDWWVAEGEGEDGEEVAMDPGPGAGAGAAEAAPTPAPIPEPALAAAAMMEVEGGRTEGEGGAAAAAPPPGPAGERKRFMIYHPRTYHQRQKGKGKGKNEEGKGKKGKGKGKGKGKAKGKGKGKEAKGKGKGQKGKGAKGVMQVA